MVAIDRVVRGAIGNDRIDVGLEGPMLRARLFRKPSAHEHRNDLRVKPVHVTRPASDSLLKARPLDPHPIPVLDTQLLGRLRVDLDKGIGLLLAVRGDLAELRVQVDDIPVLDQNHGIFCKELGRSSRALGRLLEVGEGRISRLLQDAGAQFRFPRRGGKAFSLLHDTLPPGYIGHMSLF